MSLTLAYAKMDAVRSVAVPDAIAAVLDGLAARGDRRAAKQLSDRYRAGVSSVERPAVRSDAELSAYAASRFPATYAAAVAAFSACTAADPDFAPTSVLDVGTGLGATAAAAVAVWPTLITLTCVEPDPRAASAGRTVLESLNRDVTWRSQRPADVRADLVTAGYVGNEVDNSDFVAGLWEVTSHLLVVIEPGRPATSHALVGARDAMLATGEATTLAPCPHDNGCPLPQSDWCHFGQRLPRTAVHRQLKGAALNYEDEKYSYLALQRDQPKPRSGRVIRRPVRRKNLVELTVCAPTGDAALAQVPRSDRHYRAAKAVTWGDTWPPTATTA